MAKEYIINDKLFLFSKEKFQVAVQNIVKEKRCELKRKYTYADLYNDLSNVIGVSDETVRKWYSKGGPSPADSVLVEAISEFLGLNDVTELLEEKEKDIMISHALENNAEREVIKHIYQELLDFAKKYAYREFGDEESLSVMERNTMNELQRIHLEIDKSSFELRPKTIKNLHEIILAYTENVMTSDVSSKWDALCTEDYYLVRELLRMGYSYEFLYDDKEFEEEVKAYVKKIFPYVYEDDDTFYDIPFQTEYFYLREFAGSLYNVFRNDFPEAFLFD